MLFKLQLRLLQATSRSWSNSQPSGDRREWNDDKLFDFPFFSPQWHFFITFRKIIFDIRRWYTLYLTSISENSQTVDSAQWSHDHRRVEWSGGGGVHSTLRSHTKNKTNSLKNKALSYALLAREIINRLEHTNTPPQFSSGGDGVNGTQRSSRLHSSKSLFLHQGCVFASMIAQHNNRHTVSSGTVLFLCFFLVTTSHPNESPSIFHL